MRTPLQPLSLASSTNSEATDNSGVGNVTNDASSSFPLHCLHISKKLKHKEICDVLARITFVMLFISDFKFFKDKERQHSIIFFKDSKLRWLKTHVSLQEAVLQFASRVVWNDKEKFLSPQTLTCHETTIHLELNNSFYSNAI